MKIISTYVHGCIDYAFGILLIISPWLFDFYRGGAESWVPIILGAGVVMYSMFTNYELSVKRELSMKTHLAMDVIGGIVLAASPWLFGFSEHVYLPHLILGIAEIGVAAMTTTVPAVHTAGHTGTGHTDKRRQ